MSSSFKKLKLYEDNKSYIRKLAFTVGQGLGGNDKVLSGTDEFIIERESSDGAITGLIFPDPNQSSYAGYTYLWRSEDDRNMFEVVSEPEANPYIGVVTAENLNVREGPGASNDVAKTRGGNDYIIPRGLRVSILEESRGWYRINSSNWVSARYVRKTGDRAWPIRGAVLSNLSSRPYERLFFQRLNEQIPGIIIDAEAAPTGWEHELAQSGTWGMSDDTSEESSVSSAPSSSESKINRPAARPDRPILRRNSSGPDVSELQRILVALGHDLGATGDSGDGVDGSYKSKTRSAVIAYQTSLVSSGRIPPTYIDRHGRNRSNIDGIVGNTTWSNLYDDFELKNETARVTSPGPGPLVGLPIIDDFSLLPEPSTNFAEVLGREFSEYSVVDSPADEAAWSAMSQPYRTGDKVGRNIKPTTIPRYVQFSKGNSEPVLFLIAEIPPVNNPVERFQSSDNAVYIAFPLPRGSAVGSAVPTSTQYHGRNLPLDIGGPCPLDDSGAIKARSLICFVMKELVSRSDSEHQSNRRPRLFRRDRGASRKSGLGRLNKISKGIS